MQRPANILRSAPRLSVVPACAGLAAAGLLAGVPAQAPAATFRDAVRANVWLGIQLCLRPAGTNPEMKAQGFAASGFAQAIRREGGDTYYTFTAPSGTATVEFYYGNMPDECTVRSAHMGVTEASELLDAAVPKLYPSYRRRVTYGPADPKTGKPAVCVAYEDPTNEIGEVISVFSGGPASGAPGCAENGTVEIIQSYRV